MFDWLSSVLANLAYDAAIKSVDVASHNGMHQNGRTGDCKNSSGEKLSFCRRGHVNMPSDH